MSSNNDQGSTPTNTRMRISISDGNSPKYYRAYIGSNSNPYRAYIILGGGSVIVDTAILGRALLGTMILGKVGNSSVIYEAILGRALLNKMILGKGSE